MYFVLQSSQLRTPIADAPPLSLAIVENSWDLTPRQLCDLELLLNGGFHPLAGFLTRPEYESVCRNMRLPNGALWPIPVTLDVPELFAATLKPGHVVLLRDPEGVVLARLHVTDAWQPDR